LNVRRLAGKIWGREGSLHEHRLRGIRTRMPLLGRVSK
jgi:hypothetical protein